MIRFINLWTTNLKSPKNKVLITDKLLNVFFHRTSMHLHIFFGMSYTYQAKNMFQVLHIECTAFFDFFTHFSYYD